MIRVGVVGYGYWGPNLVRNFAETARAQVTAICDLEPKRVATAKLRHPVAHVTTDFKDLIEDPKIDAIAIATPVSSHFDLAVRTLNAGKHVLVEKPLTSSSEQAARLVDLAAENRLVLMVDHTFVYTSAVRKIQELIGSGDLGQIYYYDSVRINLGLFQRDVNVIWDLAVHDLSILNYVLPYRPVAVSATGMSHVPGEAENIAYLTLFFDNSLLAHVHVNWLAPVKIRRTLIGGSRKMIVYDDLEGSEKLKVYDKGISVSEHSERIYQMKINYRAGDMWAPHLDNTEALQVEAREFIDCIQSGRRPLTDGAAGLQVVQILEAASTSIARRGALVELAKGAAA
jgi:predicted dehydrogenase